MTGNRVLCVSHDEDLLEGFAGPLESSYPQVSVLRAAAASDAIEWLSDGPVDAVVTDAETIADAPAILEAVRERRPDLPLLVLSAYSTVSSHGTAISEVVDFVDAIGDRESNETFAGWVANAVVGGRDASPPGNARPGDVVRDVKRALVDVEAPMDVERAVCDQLTAGGRYAFAWIGEYDRGEQQVIPWVTGTSVDSWPINRTFPVGTDRETLVDRVLGTRELQVVDDVRATDEAVPWGDAAREHDCRAVALAPLVEDGELYGVMGIYGSERGFSDVERSAVREIAASVSKVLHNMALRGKVKQQERTLRRYERLVETVGDGMYALDADGHFMTVNNGLVEMTGYSREGMLGEHISLILDDDSVAEGRTLIAEMLAARTNDPRTQEMVLHTKAGRTIPCETKVALLLDATDELHGTVGAVRDITDRKRRESELRRQNERLEAFASIVSHDLRNPLGVAQGYLDVAVESDSTDSLEHVAYSLDRMEDIIGDVLALARHGRTVSETEPVGLSALAREAWGNVDTKTASLVTESSATIEADRTRVLRLLENLFRNAIEHGGEDVTVRVGTFRDRASDVLGVYVADDGAGLPADVRDRLFESDFTTSEEGFGLGLWVVREVADAHGWSTRAVESESGGARFEFVGVERR